MKQRKIPNVSDPLLKYSERNQYDIDIVRVLLER
jgi:hypothetical protein